MLTFHCHLPVVIPDHPAGVVGPLRRKPTACGGAPLATRQALIPTPRTWHGALFLEGDT